MFCSIYERILISIFSKMCKEESLLKAAVLQWGAGFQIFSIAHEHRVISTGCGKTGA
jgi:hypothetical protein